MKAKHLIKLLETDPEADVVIANNDYDLYLLLDEVRVRRWNSANYAITDSKKDPAVFVLYYNDPT